MPELLERLVVHAGGADRWTSVEALDLRVRVGGLAFRMVGQSQPVADFDARVHVHRQHVYLRSRTDPAWRGTYDAGTVRLQDAEGRTVQERRDAVFTRQVPWPKRPWDAIDALAFSGHALWGYTAFPAYLRRADVTVTAVGRHTVDGARLHGVRVHLPPHLPAHAPAQTMWLDDDGAMRRVDYRARMIAPWAKAANRCLDETTLAGVTIPSVRRVTPLLPGRRAAPGPLLVSIEIELLGLVDRN